MDVDRRSEIDKLPKAMRDRLEFQMEAARIQMASAEGVAAIAGLFKRIYAHPQWSQEDTRTALSRFDDAKRLSDDWQRLKPPKPLRPLWEQLALSFEGLEELFGQAVALKDAPKTDLGDRVARLQAAFIAHLDDMSGTERELLSREEALRGT